MKTLDEKDCFGYSVVVTSWNKGRCMGCIRPAEIQRAAVDAIALCPKPARVVRMYCLLVYVNCGCCRWVY